MTTNELIPVTITEQQIHAESPEELYALLAERTSRYTMGDSTSLPLETAKRLLEGIVFCVALHQKSIGSAIPKDAPLAERHRAGIAEAKRLLRRAKLLLREAQRWQPPVMNVGFQETLSALPAFFKQYDADFFAQEVPCSIDYPLCQPVSDALCGVEYVLDYLRRWLTESALLRAYSRETLIDLYERYYGDYDDLLVNLYLPVMEISVLCALANAPVQVLRLSEAERATAWRHICAEDETAARKKIHTAAERACIELHCTGAFARAYAGQTALDLMTRLRAIDAENPASVK